jgi:hypothetical protein
MATAVWTGGDGVRRRKQCREDACRRPAPEARGERLHIEITMAMRLRRKNGMHVLSPTECQDVSNAKTARASRKRKIGWLLWLRKQHAWRLPVLFVSLMVVGLFFARRFAGHDKSL